MFFNLVERFFSAAKLTLAPLRKLMSPKRLEIMILFLKFNRDWWGIHTVHNIPARAEQSITAVLPVDGAGENLDASHEEDDWDDSDNPDGF